MKNRIFPYCYYFVPWHLWMSKHNLLTTITSLNLRSVVWKKIYLWFNEDPLETW